MSPPFLYFGVCLFNMLLLSSACSLLLHRRASPFIALMRLAFYKRQADEVNSTDANRCAQPSTHSFTYSLTKHMKCGAALVRFVRRTHSWSTDSRVYHHIDDQYFSPSPPHLSNRQWNLVCAVTTVKCLH